MRSPSSSLPPDHPQAPLSPSTGDHAHTSLGTYLESEYSANKIAKGKSESDNHYSVEDRGVLDDIGAEVIQTLRSASYKLLRFHVFDWLAIVGLAVVYGILNIIDPFYRYVGEPTIQDNMFPMKSNTIPFQAVPAIAIGIPLVIFISYFLYTKDITDLHHAILGLLFSVAITAVLTDAIKNAAGRPRPDFFWRCFPDGNAIYHNITKEVQCTGQHSVIKEGHKSFPSGHTSGSFAGLGFLSLYLAGKLQLFNCRGHVGKLAIVVAPLLAATLVGLSRVDDYWHFWNDVFGGAILGLTMATLCYHHLFPSIFSNECTGPYSYLQIGNNFKLACFSWVPRRGQSYETPPVRSGGQDRDMELG